MATPATVWIVQAGCEYNGADIKGVFVEYKDAFKAVTDWLSNQTNHFTERRHEPEGARYWAHSSDFISMEPWQVR